MSTPKEGAWFQPNGSLIVIDENGRQSPELSAPIAPCVTALNKQGSYPPDGPAQERMADEASLTFSYFLGACSEQYPIAAPVPNGALTPEQARDNYANVARCAFETHYGKPYWVPQLIDDVDLCGRVLGSEWQLPTSDSLAKFNDRHRELLHQALKDVPYGGGYNSLLLYARDQAGKLTFIDLSPPGARGASKAPFMHWGSESSKQLLQIPAASLRCVRDSPRMPATDLPPVSTLAANCGAQLAAIASAKGGKGATGPRPAPPPEAQSEAPIEK